jgi:hypothetical protein
MNYLYLMIENIRGGRRGEKYEEKTQNFSLPHHF